MSKRKSLELNTSSSLQKSQKIISLDSTDVIIDDVKMEITNESKIIRYKPFDTCDVMVHNTPTIIFLDMFLLCICTYVYIVTQIYKCINFFCFFIIVFLGSCAIVQSEG